VGEKVMSINKALYATFYGRVIVGRPRTFEGFREALYRHGLGRRAIFGFNPYALHRNPRESAREIIKASIFRRSMPGRREEPRRPMGFAPKREEPHSFFPMPRRGRMGAFPNPFERRRSFFPMPR